MSTFGRSLDDVVGIADVAEGVEAAEKKVEGVTDPTDK